MYDTRTQGRTDVKVEIVMLINFQSKGFTKRKKRSHQVWENLKVLVLFVTKMNKQKLLVTNFRNYSIKVSTSKFGN